MESEEVPFLLKKNPDFYFDVLIKLSNELTSFVGSAIKNKRTLTSPDHLHIYKNNNFVINKYFLFSIFLRIEQNRIALSLA